MPRLPLNRVALLLAALVLVFAVGFAVETLALFPTIGCEADGFCNTRCLSDPDCGAPSCQHGKPCTTNADCEPLGECATWRQCVCFGCPDIDDRMAANGELDDQRRPVAGARGWARRNRA